MALAPSAQYPAQTDADPAYPHGKARNAGSFQDGTGTPLEKTWINDLWGFLQSLLKGANLPPSGVPDQVGASQYLDAINYIQNRTANEAALLRLRNIDISGAFTDTNGFLAAIARLNSPSVLVIKSGATDTRYIFDQDDSGQTVAGSTTGLSDVIGVARNGSRLVAIGSGGNRCNFSTNEGQTWAAGSDLGASPDMGGIIYVPTHSRFMVTFAAGVNVAQDVDGNSTWASVSSGLTGAQGGIAAFSNGDVLVAGTDGASDVAIARSTNGGGSWAAAATVPNAGDYDDSGRIVGDGGSVIYHAGRALSGAELRVCSTTAAMSWQLLATITPPGVVTGKPRILLCPDTGVLVIIFATGTGSWAVASRDQGKTWTAASACRTRFFQSWALARGRLFSTFGGNLYATDQLT